MRRIIGVVAGLALGVALCSAFGRAADLPQAPQRNDIASQLMLQLFGETSDSRASFAAARGDRTSESLLRDMALQVRPVDTRSSVSSGVADAFGEERVAFDALAYGVSDINLTAQFNAPPSVVHFTVPSASSTDAAVLVPPDEHFTVAYRPVPPLPAISPAPGTLAFLPPDAHAVGFVPSNSQFGSVRLEGHTSSDQPSQSPQLDLRDAAYNAGANFDLRAGKRNVNINLSSQYEQVGHDLGSSSVSPVASASSWQLPENAPLFVPNSLDLNRLSLNAGVAFPVVRGLTLNLNYDAQRLYGAYGQPGFINLDTMSNTYGGNLTFNIPHISSSLSIGAYQDRFQDSILPINGQTQTREDVNFTVKF